jgi:hypothetical protein
MKKIDLEEALKKVSKINDVVSKLDSEIKVSAFDFLMRVAFTELPKIKSEVDDDKSEETVGSDAETFLSKYSHDQPSDNVFLVVAWLYSQHGIISLTQNIIKDVADNAGLTIPNRPDMTMKKAQSEGKKLFVKSGNGYKLTVNGEAYLKKTYKVKKGNKSLSQEGVE